MNAEKQPAVAGPVDPPVRPVAGARGETMHNIFAHTEPTPPEGYPAYISINRDEQGVHTITVRSRGNGGRDVAIIEVSPETLEALHVAVAADLYRDEKA